MDITAQQQSNWSNGKEGEREKKKYQVCGMR